MTFFYIVKIELHTFNYKTTNVQMYISYQYWHESHSAGFIVTHTHTRKKKTESAVGSGVRHQLTMKRDDRTFLLRGRSRTWVTDFGHWKQISAVFNTTVSDKMWTFVFCQLVSCCLRENDLSSAGRRANKNFLFCFDQRNYSQQWPLILQHLSAI